MLRRERAPELRRIALIGWRRRLRIRLYGRYRLVVWAGIAGALSFLRVLDRLDFVLPSEATGGNQSSRKRSGGYPVPAFE